MEFLSDYAGFLIRLLSIALVIALLLSAIAGMKSKPKDPRGRLSIRQINDELRDMKEDLMAELMDKKAYKQWRKSEKKQLKLAQEFPNKVFVLDFDGDIQASEVSSLREEVTAILAVATTADEVVVNLLSGGGVVHGYGLAASQLQRIKIKGIRLTVCVDKVAASGGYMMACVADKIIAAPFAIVGSIGVVAQVPNIHRLLDKNAIDVELHTAGQFKRTLTVLGENTDEGREKFKQDLENTHELFKHHVAKHREGVDIEKIATGEIWYGSEAKDIGLVDAIMTSDDYILDQSRTAKVIKMTYKTPKSMGEKLGLSAAAVIEQRGKLWLSKLLQFRGF